MIGLFLGVLLGQVTSGGEKPIDFQRDVAPILQQHCLDCHSATLQMAELRLDQKEFVLVDDGRGLVKPGKSGESLLIQRLTDRKLGILMPPSFPFLPGEKAGLPAAKLAVLKSWIDQGATWPEGVVLVSEATSESPAMRALLAAIRSGKPSEVQGLLDKQPDLINSRARDGGTPLIEAAAFADVQLVQLLLDRGADVNAANHEGATALMRAAGDLEKVQLLLGRGANVQAKSASGRTAVLIAATYAGNIATLKLLMEKGASIKEPDSFGERCLTSACKRGDAEMAKLLLSGGADVVAGTRPPLIWAAEEGNVATVACLLEHSVKQPPPIVSAALCSAAVRGPSEMVQLLLKHGADPNAPSRLAGYTPLMLAAYSDVQNAELVGLLLGQGADKSRKGENGETAASLARKFGSTTIVALLENKTPEKVAADAALAEKELPPLRPAIEKSLKLLQEAGPQFFIKSGCAACHQQSVASLAVAAARIKGVPVDEQIARKEVATTSFSWAAYRERFLQRVDHPAGSASSVGYISLGLAAEKYPADEATDAMIFEVAGRQRTDGSWTAFGHRPPLENSPHAATALAVRAMQLYGPPAMKPQLDSRIARARAWLLANPAKANADRNFRLLGLAWSGADENALHTERDELLRLQGASGGWSQHPCLAPDAFATGLTLFALHESGQLAATDKAYQNGVAWLRRTQLDDGSWHVKTRAFPFQEYFESGFPHGHDQWISAAATGYATVALLNTLP